MSDKTPSCVYCPTIRCCFGTKERVSRFCPGLNSSERIGEARRALDDRRSSTAVLYTSDSYYSRLKNPEVEGPG